MKKLKIDYDQIIQNKDDLLKQLHSLLNEANCMMYCDEIFIKDAHALRIAIRILEELKE